MEKYLEFEEGGSHKFWQITLDGESFTVQYGKVGTAGQTQTKTFADAATAEKEATKLLNSKLKKGYAEATSKSGGQTPPIQAAPTKAATPAVTIRKAYWELQDGSFFIYMQWDRWVLSLRYQKGKASEAQPRSVGNLSEKSAIEDFEEDTADMLPKKKQDVTFKEIPLAELDTKVKEIAKTLSGKKADFQKEADDFLKSLPPVLPEPLFESALALVQMIQNNYASKEAGIPLEQIKTDMLEFFKEVFKSKKIPTAKREACLKELDSIFSKLPPVIPEEMLDDAMVPIEALTEKIVDGTFEAAAEQATAESSDSATKYYEVDGKFWAITLDGSSFTVQFGKIGTNGQTQEKSFGDEDEAAKEAEKLIKSKTKKGYALAKLPASMAQASAKPKTAAAPELSLRATPEAPKPKAHTLPEAGPDVT
ncbi:MAG: WGR domain-containing protein, partial [Deferribacteraceae bacterium]|nr:WGR domain-containing protein [Deferribacteraceae bacterium]